MNISKFGAGGAGIALVAAMTMAGATSAQAADFYIEDSDIGVELVTYPAGWFTGTLSDPTEAGTLTSTSAGLEVTGKVQLLNGTPSETDLTEQADNTFATSANGDWTFQIPIFADGAGDSGFTILSPVGEGNPDSTTQWVTSGAIAGATSTDADAYAAGATATLVEFETALDAQVGNDYQILAYGLFFDNGAVDTLYEVENAVDRFFFTPPMTAAAAPTPITLADASNASKGVTVSATGFIQGESVEIYIGTPDGNGGFLANAVVDVNGNVTYRHVLPANAPLGLYTLSVADDDGDFINVRFTVVATPLPATGTGVDVTVPAIGAAALLVLGAALMLVVRRRGAVRSS